MNRQNIGNVGARSDQDKVGIWYMTAMLSCGNPERGKTGKRSGATLAHVGTDFGSAEVQQCRVRTWLQLMCCAFVLELGVLISEQLRKCGGCDGAECDGAESRVLDQGEQSQGQRLWNIENSQSTNFRLRLSWAKWLSRYSDWGLTTQLGGFIYRKGSEKNGQYLGQ